MKRSLLLVAFPFLALTAIATETTPNQLTPAEVKAGWKLLWDGKTSAGWRAYREPAFPAVGWQMKDGVLTVLDSSGGASSGPGGDIMTTEKFSDFELAVDFKISAGANSGIKYFVPASDETNKGAGIGFEFQVLDDERHPDAKMGAGGNRTVGSLYDLIPAATNKKINPPGEWNSARVISRGAHVEHWLNGRKVLEYERFTPAFRERVAASKYKSIAGFGEWTEGRILLQDHGAEVSFRNLKIRALRQPGK